MPQIIAVATSNAFAVLPRVPAAAEWRPAVRNSVVMDTSKAKRDLGCSPAHTSAETLAAMADAL